MLFNSVPWSKCLKATMPDAKRKGRGVKRKGEEERKRSGPADRLKGTCWLRLRNVCNSNWFNFMEQRLTKERNQSEKPVVNATGPYVTITWIEHKNIPHIWASVTAIIKACTPRIAFLGRIRVIYASAISQLSNTSLRQGASESLEADATAPAKAASLPVPSANSHQPPLAFPDHTHTH